MINVQPFDSVKGPCAALPPAILPQIPHFNKMGDSLVMGDSLDDPE